MNDAWLPLNSQEKIILLDALSSLRLAGQASSKEIDDLTLKLVHTEAYPKITVGCRAASCSGCRVIRFQFVFVITTQLMNVRSRTQVGSNRSLKESALLAEIAARTNLSAQLIQEFKTTSR